MFKKLIDKSVKNKVKFYKKIFRMLNGEKISNSSANNDKLHD